jgi:hypothetical protein
MKKLLVIVIMCALAWQVHLTLRRQGQLPIPAAIAETTTPVVAEATLPPAPAPAPAPATVTELVAANNTHFTCDGRKYCQQMTSCDEARYFMKNCPGTHMDGDNDGIPCEMQYCGHR